MSLFYTNSDTACRMLPMKLHRLRLLHLATRSSRVIEGSCTVVICFRRGLLADFFEHGKNEEGVCMWRSPSER